MKNFNRKAEGENPKRLIIQKRYRSAEKLKSDVKEVLNKYSKLLSENYCAFKESKDMIRISADIDQYWFDAEIKINNNRVLIDYETNAPSLIERLAITSVKHYFVLQ